jgi:hypothetical protein
MKPQTLTLVCRQAYRARTWSRCTRDPFLSMVRSARPSGRGVHPRVRRLFALEDAMLEIFHEPTPVQLADGGRAKCVARWHDPGTLTALGYTDTQSWVPLQMLGTRISRDQARGWFGVRGHRFPDDDGEL